MNIMHKLNDNKIIVLIIRTTKFNEANICPSWPSCIV